MKLTLAAKHIEVPGVTTFVFGTDDPMTWQAGQFMHYTLQHDPADDRKTQRWFTISSAPHEGHVQLTTRITPEKGSSFKKALGGLEVGNSIVADMPEGDFVINDATQPLLLIAGGIGITPYRSILLELDHEGATLSGLLLYGNKDESYVFRDELEAVVAHHPDFHIQYCTGGPEAMNADVLKTALESLQDPQVYISGPEPMVESMDEVFKELGVPHERMHGDYFPGYLWA